MRTLDRLAVGGLIAVLTWLLFKGLSPVDARLENALHGLDAYAASESALHRDVLSAHAGLLNNYDPLDADVFQMRQAVQRITAQGVSPVERAQGDALAANFRRQQAQAERFKTGNALVRNSLAYFATYSGVVAARAGTSPARGAVDRLSSAMLHLSLNGSRGAQDGVERAIDALARACRRAPCPREAQSLLAHGRLLKQILPDLAATIETLVRSGSEQPIQHLRSDLLRQQQTAEAAAGQFRVLLYLASLLLVYLLVRWGLQLRAHSAALRRQLVLEHAVSRLSTRLIAAAPESILGVVRDALADLGTTLGASQAQFFDGHAGQTCAWPDPLAALPTRWPEWIAGHSLAFGDHGHRVIHLNRDALPRGGSPRAALEKAGVDHCYCILPPDGGENHSMLAFGYARGRGEWQLRQLAVLRTALDAISLSLDHARLAEERARLEGQLEHARRMETVGAFASGIAHNFNNLLGAIAGHVEMAADAAEGIPLLRDHMEKIGLSADRGRQLVGALLRYGRRHASQRESVDLDALILESCCLAQATLTDAHRIDFRGGAPDACVQADAAQLQQVVLNLCNNAAQAMPEGGVIRVRTRYPSAGTPGGTLLPRGESRVILTISDTGCGIAPDLLDKIFEPFFTTRDSGTGLGLSTARDIVVDQGGIMTLDSVVDGGTTATIVLPFDVCSAPEFLGSGETILFLAEDEGQGLAGEDLLAALHYEPVGFADAEKALAALEATPRRFQAIVITGSDLGSAPRRLLARAKMLCPDAPRILAVRHYDTHTPAMLTNAGVSSLLQFPLDAREVAIILRRALAAASM